MEEKYSSLVKKLLKNCKNCGGEIEIAKDFYCSCGIDDFDNPHAIIGKGIIYVDAICKNCGYMHRFSKDFLDKK